MILMPRVSHLYVDSDVGVIYAVVTSIWEDVDRHPPVVGMFRELRIKGNRMNYNPVSNGRYTRVENTCMVRQKKKISQKKSRNNGCI
jgi:hypothetical protein